MRPPRLTARREFLAAAKARKASMPGFVLQARPRKPEEAERVDAPLIRVGFTASKKVGNAVIRNRAKRRLRAIADAILPLEGRPGWDYVLVALKDGTVGREFATMRTELSRALAKVHASKPASARGGARQGRDSRNAGTPNAGTPNARTPNARTPNARKPAEMSSGASDQDKAGR